MRFAYVADVPWWAIARHGEGLVKYGSRVHQWELFCCIHYEPSFVGKVDLDEFDAVVYGCAPVADLSFRSGWYPRHADTACLVTMASYRDARGMAIADAETNEELDISYVFAHPRVQAIVINDECMAPFAVKYEKPTFFHPDRVDTELFRRKRINMGTVPRIGWAGSDRHWRFVKHLDAIREAVAETRAELVLQRREVEGLKDAKAMADWFNTLDGYICANDELTPNPVPVIEAMCCGVPCVTTRAGSAWRIMAGIAPSLVLANTTPQEIRRGVEQFLTAYSRPTPRAELSRQVGTVGRALLGWEETGEAGEFSKTVAALCESM